MRPFSGFWPGAPRIVAEALAPVPDPLLTGLRPGPWATPEAVARALAHGLLPEEDPCPAPAWLLAGQVRSFRRVMAALRRYRGALLADPVGSGKTYVALAAAATLSSGRSVACVVPATLVRQWRETADLVGVPVSLRSHEQVSRGRLPGGTPRVVVIDEVHRFRNPASRRYLHLAPWLMGRRVVLLTATPVVNQLTDLLHELLLCIRDDALLPDGVPSLRGLLGGGMGSAALGRLVIERPNSAARPVRRMSTSEPHPDESAAAARALALIGRLRLSRSRPIASLVRSVLQRAASSSPPALVGALRRYRGLLLHARDAIAAGRPPDRAAIRRFTGYTGDQLCWWELLPASDGAAELDLSDLAELEPVLAEALGAAEAPDPKLERLRELLADDLPTLVFVARRETVRHLRDRLRDRRIAWCTGERAGLGTNAVLRASVLAWFREGRGAADAARIGVNHLLVTDVAAEGLDLQRAARVVHYDLPWTPMRMDQREGRALRLGSLHREVEVVRFQLPAVLERALRVEETLRRKRRLPDAVGLGPRGRLLWRWRSELGEALQGGEAVCGVGAVRSRFPGALAGIAIQATGTGEEGRLAFTLLWIRPDGTWTEDEETVAARLSSATAGAEGTRDADLLRTALKQLAEPARQRLVSARERRWAEAEPGAPARVIAARLHDAIRDAARRRDPTELHRLERALGFVAGGHTAGEAMLLERLAVQSAAEIVRASVSWPAPTPRWGPLEARLEGLVMFVPE